MSDESTASKDEQGMTAEYNFEDVYANNSSFETSAWDLKLIFGQLDQTSRSKRVVNWHTAVTIPWAQAKIMAYYLAINVVFHEIQHGPIKVPSTVLPPFPREPLEEEGKAAKDLVEMMRFYHEHIFGEQSSVRDPA